MCQSFVTSRNGLEVNQEFEVTINSYAYILNLEGNGKQSHSIC
jgi:hypothetical protein